MSSPKSGFTLIELLLVSALLIMLAGVVFPRMSRTVRSRSIETNAEDFAHFVRFSRREAMRLQRDLTLHLSRDGDAYWLSQFSSNSVAPTDDRVGSEEKDGFFDERVRFSQGISIDEIRRNSERIGLREITFSPSGVSANISFRLQDGEGRKKFVVVGAWVDQVLVEDGLEEDMEGSAR